MGTYSSCGGEHPLIDSDVGCNYEDPHASPFSAAGKEVAVHSNEEELAAAMVSPGLQEVAAIGTALNYIHPDLLAGRCSAFDQGYHLSRYAPHNVHCFQRNDGDLRTETMVAEPYCEESNLLSATALPLRLPHESGVIFSEAYQNMEDHFASSDEIKTEEVNLHELFNSAHDDPDDLFRGKKLLPVLRGSEMQYMSLPPLLQVDRATPTKISNYLHDFHLINGKLEVAHDVNVSTMKQSERLSSSVKDNVRSVGVADFSALHPPASSNTTGSQPYQSMPYKSGLVGALRPRMRYQTARTANLTAARDRLRMRELMHSRAAAKRRRKIQERLKFLRAMIPGGSKIGTHLASMLDLAANYVRFLQAQTVFLRNEIQIHNQSLPSSTACPSFSRSIAGTYASPRHTCYAAPYSSPLSDPCNIATNLPMHDIKFSPQDAFIDCIQKATRLSSKALEQDPTSAITHIQDEADGCASGNVHYTLAHWSSRAAAARQEELEQQANLRLHSRGPSIIGHGLHGKLLLHHLVTSVHIQELLCRKEYCIVSLEQADFLKFNPQDTTQKPYPACKEGDSSEKVYNIFPEL
ncbi:hypothetical protein KP509_03G093100 [Ceratopteris richardii]|uniref:BHLH domain-containing protein n=1 Tax=Ceratopteris richardii TaxID=49495 RepID=A0A8T2V5R1_CERRI|nr:hypothetical protein KP509_03G093100 [Ceratopteris richardii]